MPWGVCRPASAPTSPTFAIGGFVTTERRGRQIVYRLVLRGLDDLVDQAGDPSEPVAERLATCTRVGPEWA
jgi:phytoene/squalene synthetase